MGKQRPCQTHAHVQTGLHDRPRVLVVVVLVLLLVVAAAAATAVAPQPQPTDRQRRPLTPRLKPAFNNTLLCFTKPLASDAPLCGRCRLTSFDPWLERRTVSNS